MLLIRKGTLSAVLSLSLLSSSFFADLVGATGNEKHDDVSSRRQLKPRNKRSKKTRSPTTAPFPPFFTSTYRVVGKTGVTIDATSSTQPGGRSFVGTKRIQTRDIFLPDNVIVDGNFVETIGNPIGTYTITSQVDSGAFPFIETQSGSETVCFPERFFGGCILLQSGGEFKFNIIADDIVDFPGSVSSGANTGVKYFGIEYFTVKKQLSPAFTDPDVPGSDIEVTQVEITQLNPTNYIDIIERNVILGKQVPGFIPKEGENLLLGEANGNTKFEDVGGPAGMFVDFPKLYERGYARPF